MSKAINTAPATPDEVRMLRGTIEFMDGLAQEGLSQIEGIASLALLALETPSGSVSMEDIAAALEAIREKAEVTMAHISNQAEEWECNATNEAKRRRREASFRWLDELRKAHPQGAQQ